MQQALNLSNLPYVISHVALMPDAHVGYGLPIGGVLATDNAVIPYAVGVDIACRMMMTVFDLPPESVDAKRDRFRRILENNTRMRGARGADDEGSDDVDHADEALVLLREIRDALRDNSGAHQ